MNELHKSQQAADQTALTDASREILHRIIRLRWMGMERQARRLQRTLLQAPPAGGEITAEREADEGIAREN